MATQPVAIARTKKVKKPDPWTRVQLGGGVTGALAPDPGSGRWLWSVRWPAHACRTVECPVPSTPQLFRHGVEPTEKKARSAIATAHSSGPPRVAATCST